MPEGESVDTAMTDVWESAHAVVSHVKKAIPWLGDPMQKALSRDLTNREATRVGEVIGGITGDLRGFSSELTELYIKTRDFGKFLEQILTRVAEERHKEKRDIYRAFLLDAITSPCDPLDKQLKLLQILRELRLDQIRLLQFIAAPDEADRQLSLSPFQMIREQIPDIHPERIKGLLAQMDELGIIRLADLETADMDSDRKIANCLTPVGRHLLKLANVKK